MPKCGICGTASDEMCRNKMPFGPDYYCEGCCPHCTPGFEDMPPTYEELYNGGDDDE